MANHKCGSSSVPSTSTPCCPTIHEEFKILPPTTLHYGDVPISANLTIHDDPSDHKHSKVDACCSHEVPGVGLSIQKSPQPKPSKTGGQPPVQVGDSKTGLFQLSGVTCADCQFRLEEGLKRLDGVVLTRITLVTQRAEIEFTNNIDEQTIVNWVDKLGFGCKVLDPDASGSVMTLECGVTINDRTLDALKGFKGVTSCTLNVPNGSILKYDYDHEMIAPRHLIQRVKDTIGSDDVKFIPPTKEISLVDKSLIRQWWIGSVWSTLFCIPIIVWQYVLPAVSSSKEFADDGVGSSGVSSKAIIGLILSTPIQFYFGWPLYKSAYASVVISRTANVDLLVMLSSTVAYVYSIVNMGTGSSEEVFFETPAFLLALIYWGRYLETLAKGRTSKILSTLIDLQPGSATICEDSTNFQQSPTIDINVHLLHVGDVIKVIPGSRIPTDGIVIQGASAVDESMVTGESLSVSKGVGDTVIGSTINQNGVIYFRVTRLINDNTLAGITRLVLRAQSEKPPVQSKADFIASIFVPVVVVAAFLTFGIWYGIAYNNQVDKRDQDDVSTFTFAIQFALSVLVVACPCAVGLAVPMPIVSGTAVAAQSFGLLFKGGGAMQKCNEINTICFDKTGTLTTGKLQHFRTQVLLPDFRESTLWFLIGTAEQSSEHSIGRSLTAAAQSRSSVPLNSPTEFTAIPGRGLTCTITIDKAIENTRISDGTVRSNIELGVGVHELILGTEALMNQSNIAIPPEVTSIINEWSGYGSTIILIVLDRQIIGLTSCIDTLKPESKFVVETLQEMGIDVWMISGDRISAATTIAKQCGIPPSRVLGGVLPGDKANRVQLLQKASCEIASDVDVKVKKRQWAPRKKNHSVVGMIGDGINDSPALSIADVGFAVAQGSDVAIEAADVVMMKDDMKNVVTALMISRATFNTISLNLRWAFFYNVLAVVLATGLLYKWNVYIPPEFAGVSEVFSAIPVIIFSYFLQRYLPKIPSSPTTHASEQNGDVIVSIPSSTVELS